MKSDEKYDADGDSDGGLGDNNAALKRGRESAQMKPKSASDYIADAQASGKCTCGATLGK
jgi:hypothetical protein